MKFKKLIFSREEDRLKVIRNKKLKMLRDEDGKKMSLFIRGVKKADLLCDNNVEIVFNQKYGQYHIKGLYIKTISPIGLLRCYDLLVKKINEPTFICGKNVENGFYLRTTYGCAIIPSEYYKGVIEQ